MYMAVFLSLCVIKREKKDCSVKNVCLMAFFFFLSDQKLVPEQEDEAEENGTGCLGSCLPGKRCLSVDALPQAAGLQTRALPQVSLCSSSIRGPVPCILCPASQSAVQLPSAPGLFLPVQQPPGSHAAFCHKSACGFLPNLPSVLLTLSPVQLHYNIRLKMFMVLFFLVLMLKERDGL